jgi:hypothetical protein
MLHRRAQAASLHSKTQSLDALLDAKDIQFAIIGTPVSPILSNKPAPYFTAPENA